MCANGHYNIYSAINSIDDEKNICWTSIYQTWYLFDHSFSIVSLLNKERMEIICTCCSEILSIFGWVKCWKSGSVNASMFHEIRRMSNHRTSFCLFGISLYPAQSERMKYPWQTLWFLTVSVNVFKCYTESICKRPIDRFHFDLRTLIDDFLSHFFSLLFVIVAWVCVMWRHRNVIWKF